MRPTIRSTLSLTQLKRLNVAEHLRAQAHVQGDALAVAVADRSGGFSELSFAQLEARSDKMAHALLAHGITRGTRAIIMVPPSPEFYALTFAMFKIGAVSVFLDPAMGASALKVCMTSVEPQAFIGVAKAHWARVAMRWHPVSLRQTLKVGPGISPGTALEKVITQAKSPPRVASVRADELAAVLFTSGSTGVPKGVEYTHGMFAAQVQMIRDGFGIRPGERDLSTFPLFALFGPALGMASVVPRMDARSPAKTDPLELVAAVKRYGCTTSFMSPALVTRLGEVPAAHRKDLASLRRVISAGAPSRPKALQRLAQVLDDQAEIVTPYGMTEAMPLTWIDHHELARAQPSKEGGVCVGHALPGVRLDIVDIDHRPLTGFAPLGQKPPMIEDLSEPTALARRLLRGEVGEIVVTAPVASPRYWSRPMATKASKIGAAEPGVPHRTGDLGYMDKEGRLWVCGRKAHRVQTGSRRYLTLPCESVVNEVPGVLRSALVGVGAPGAQEPVFCVELAAGQEPTSVLNKVQAAIDRHACTMGIKQVFAHPGLPMDVRHNAKIHRESLVPWAAKQIRRRR